MMKRFGSLVVAVVALGLASSACTVEDEPESRELRAELIEDAKEEAAATFEDYVSCLSESSDDCQEEDAAFGEALEYLESVDGDIEFRAKSIADCGNGVEVSCSGDTCVAIDNVGCGCSTGGVDTIKTCAEATQVAPIA